MGAFSKQLLTIVLAAISAIGMGYAQPKLEFSLKKPEKFEERKLGSEKSADKKFTKVRRFFQNTYSHYNYYFNANQKLIAIVDQAKRSQKDDYTELLSFHPYSLENTSQSRDLDSVLQTATAGILLHDLRNDWIDNLYLALGKAYFYRKDFDSAMMTFQFINFSYAPKEEGGYHIPIGSNVANGSGGLSIASPEKSNLFKKMLSRPPSRNESFLWMIRTQTEQGNFIDAASLVSTIKNDPIFPERLQTALFENISYLYYKQEIWDSAAAYKEKAIDLADGIEAKARAWYLIGQLYALANNYDKAVEAFANCSKIAVDPVMDIYARLNTIRMRKGEDPSIIDRNIADLMALARKDRYSTYRDIIYYAAGLFEMERKGYPAADDYLLHSIGFNENNPQQRSQSFMLLGDARFANKTYGKAAMPYDSALTNLLKFPDSLRVEERRPGTKSVSEAEEIIFVQDSLLKVAAMPEAERMELVKALNKKLRKAKGLKEETEASANLNNREDEENNTTFTAPTGTWYFYDANRRTNGFNAFKRKWGDRPNADNWRRSAARPFGNSNNNRPAVTGTVSPTPIAKPDDLEPERYDTADISFDNLYSRLPLSPEKQKSVNHRINYAMFYKGTALHEQIEDYPEAIKVFEALLARLDTGKLVPKALFALIHCYTKVGNLAAAEAARQKLKNKFPSQPETILVFNGKANEAKKKAREEAVTLQYQEVYDLYLEGAFPQAIRKKAIADSIYGTTYWTPQLMFIETVYYLKQREDSIALKRINAIISMYPGHALEPRLKLIKELLPKRKEIEEYLAKLDIKRLTDEEGLAIVTAAPKVEEVIEPEPEETDPNLPGNLRNKAGKTGIAQKGKPDKSKVGNHITAPKSGRNLQADTTGTAALIALLNPPDPEGLNKPGSITGKVSTAHTEKQTDIKPTAKNAHNKVAAPKSIEADTTGTAALIARLNPPEPEGLNKPGSITGKVSTTGKEKQTDTKPTAKNADNKTVITPKQLAADTTGTAALIEKTRPQITDTVATAITPSLTQKDTSIAVKNVAIPTQKTINADSVSRPKIVAKYEPLELGEPIALPANTGMPSEYNFHPAAPINVVIVLENIDPAYVNEVYYELNNHPMRNSLQARVSVEKKKIKDKLWLVVIRSDDFNTAPKAYQYIQYLKPLAANEIFSWLDTRKYRYLLIDENNLNKLSQSTNLGSYEQMLNQIYPGKF